MNTTREVYDIIDGNLVIRRKDTKDYLGEVRFVEEKWLIKREPITFEEIYRVISSPSLRKNLCIVSIVERNRTETVRDEAIDNTDNWDIERDEFTVTNKVRFREYIAYIQIFYSKGRKKDE